MGAGGWPTAHRKRSSERAFRRTRPGAAFAPSGDPALAPRTPRGGRRPKPGFGPRTPFGPTRPFVLPAEPYSPFTPNDDFGPSPLTDLLEEIPGFGGRLGRKLIPIVGWGLLAYEVFDWLRGYDGPLPYPPGCPGYNWRRVLVCNPPPRPNPVYDWRYNSGHLAIGCLTAQAGSPTACSFPLSDDGTALYLQYYYNGAMELRFDWITKWFHDAVGAAEPLTVVPGGHAFGFRPYIPTNVIPALDAYPFTYPMEPSPQPGWRVIPSMRALPLSPQTRESGYSPSRPPGGHPHVSVAVDVFFPNGTGPKDWETTPEPNFVITTTPVGPARTPAPAREREEKQGVTMAVRAVAGRAISGLSEANDVIDSLFAALPRDVRQRYREKAEYIYGREGRWVYNRATPGGGSNWVWVPKYQGRAARRIRRRANFVHRAQAVNENWDEIDWSEATENLIRNEVQDQIVGRAFRRARDAARRIDRTGGLWGKVQTWS